MPGERPSPGHHLPTTHQIGEIVLDGIASLLPGHTSKKYNRTAHKWEERVQEPNIDHPTVIDSIRKHLANRPRLDWQGLAHSVRSGEKQAIYTVAAIGTISIVVAAAGVEIGRHGRDLHHLLDLLDPKDNPEKKA
jgi:hypothetical protein